MAPCVRETDIKASPATIWKACFEPMKWESWDPDVERLEEVNGGVTDGSTFCFIMKEGPIKKIPVTLSDVAEHETVRFAGAAASGAIKFDGFIEIKAVGDSSTSSHVKYSFDMTGPLGSFVNWVNPKPIIEGVEKGLENIKSLSEEAGK